MAKNNWSTEERRLAESDHRNDARILVITVLVAFAVFGVATVPQVALQAVPADSGTALLSLIGARIAVNLAVLIVCLALLIALDPLRHRGVRVVADALVVVLAVVAVRIPLQIARGVYTPVHWRQAVIECATVALLVAVVVTIGLLHVATRRRIRVHERNFARQALAAAAALNSLASEELRARREIAQRLNDTVQRNLAVLEDRVGAIGAMRSADQPDEEQIFSRLSDIRSAIESIRDTDVRGLRQLLYPVGLELGATAALRLLMDRLPPTITRSVAVADRVLDLEGDGKASLSLDRRLLLVRIAEESLTNSLRHGRASAIRLELELADGILVLTFDDNGRGLGPAPQPAGMARLQERLRLLDGTLDFGDHSPLGGARVVARMPVGSVDRVTQPVAQLGHERADHSFEAAVMSFRDS